jgi:hypothetical protein
MRTVHKSLLFSCLLLVCSALYAVAQSAETPAPLQLVSVQPEKIYYDAKAPITGQVALKNTTDAVQTARVTAWLEAGLGRKTPQQTQTVTIPAKQMVPVAFRWKAAPLGMYGYALQCRVEGAGAPLAGHEYFTVCDSYWNVALSSSHPIAYTAGATEKQITDRLAQLRSEYYNGYEEFFWAPDDFADMTPEQETYYSGQARYHESANNLKLLVREAHRLGMKVTTYGKSIGSGSAGAAFVRAHPETVYRNDDGWLNMEAKVRALAYWNKPQNWSGQAGDKWQETNWIFYNMNDPAVVEYGSLEVARSAQMFGWDGVRFDGHFAAHASWQDANGQTHRLTPQERDAQTAANIQRMKEIVHRTVPNFYFGYNYLNDSAAIALRTGPLEFKELCRGGGHLMDEYIGQAGGSNHPLHHWKDFIARMTDDTQAVQQNGGYYFPILNYKKPDLWYADAVAYAAGAHPYYTHVWGAFATRYAGVLWDRALQRVNDPTKVLSAPEGVWWRAFVHQRDAGKNRRQVIVHFINPPVSDVVTNDDKQGLPQPLHDMAVQVSPAALGTGWKLSAATLLDPDDVSQTSLALTPTTGGKAQVTVPHVRVWSVLVLDFTKNA